MLYTVYHYICLELYKKYPLLIFMVNTIHKKRNNTIAEFLFYAYFIVKNFYINEMPSYSYLKMMPNKVLGLVL